MSDLYTILINEDHSFIHTNKKKIMYRSTNIDKIRFLVNQTYGDLDMSKVNAVLEYVLPISHTYDTIILKQSEELYKNRVEFILPIDLTLTSEVGELELTINFSYLEMKEDGTFVERVRKIGTTYITIHKTPTWSDYIPDAKLDNIAQIMLKQQSLLEEQLELAEIMAMEKADGIAKDEETNEIYLTSQGVKLGTGVVDETVDEDGVPVIDFGSYSGSDDTSTPEVPEEESNVVEF